MERDLRVGFLFFHDCLNLPGLACFKWLPGSQQDGKASGKTDEEQPLTTKNGSETGNVLAKISEADEADPPATTATFTSEPKGEDTKDSSNEKAKTDDSIAPENKEAKEDAADEPPPDNGAAAPSGDASADAATSAKVGSNAIMSSVHFSETL